MNYSDRRRSCNGRRSTEDVGPFTTLMGRGWTTPDFELTTGLLGITDFAPGRRRWRAIERNLSSVKYGPDSASPCATNASRQSDRCRKYITYCTLFRGAPSHSHILVSSTEYF